MSYFLLGDKQIKGVIFDMDGTMVDNMMVHHKAWQKKLAEYGLVLALEEVMEKVHGVNEEILERLFGDQFSPEERRKISFEKESEYRQIFRTQLGLINGLTKLLDQLDKAQIPFGIGTAAPALNANFVLDELNIRSRFKSVVHSGNVTKGKPDPEVFQKAADGLGIPVEDCLVFEDSVTGVETAHRAGSQAVVVTTTHKEEEFSQFPNVFKFIKDFTELELIQKDGQWEMQ